MPLSPLQKKKMDRFSQDLEKVFGEGVNRFGPELRERLLQLWERGQGIPFEDLQEKESKQFILDDPRALAQSLQEVTSLRHKFQMIGIDPDQFQSTKEPLSPLIKDVIAITLTNIIAEKEKMQERLKHE